MITYDKQVIGYITFFENLTSARVKDCFLGKELTFIVYEGEAGRAIGRNGENLKRLGGMLNKKIRVVEFNSDVAQFVKNLISPLKGKIESTDEKTVTIEMPDPSSKAILIGRNRQNIKKLQDIVKKYFDVILKVS